MFKLLFATILFSLTSLAHNKDIGPVSTDLPRDLKDIGIDEKLGAQIDSSLMVKDETGQLRPLGDFISKGKPTLFSLVYYSCPGLCNFHLNGVTETLQKIDWTVGGKFDVVALSFDAKETPELAAKKKQSYLSLYNKPDSASGWHFLTASPEVIQKITATVGFKFKKDENTNEWAHASAAIILTPEGKISRYLHGILFEPRDMKFALIEAANGKFGTLTEKLVWFCYKYDPHQSKYTIAAFRLIQIGGIAIVILLLILLVPFWLRTRKERVGV